MRSSPGSRFRRDATGTVPIRAERALARLHRQGLRSGTGRVRARPADQPGRRSTGTQFDEWRRAFRGRLPAPAKFELARDKLRVGIPLPRTQWTSRNRISFPPSTDRSTMPASSTFAGRRSSDCRASAPVRRAQDLRRCARLERWPRARDSMPFPARCPKAAAQIGDTGAKAILWAVLGAVLGGLLLNLMPCVFPILALKALHLAKGGGEEAEARRDALGYAAGAIIGTGALGAVLLALRAAGSRGGVGIPAAGPAHRPGAFPSAYRHHPEPSAGFRSAGRRPWSALPERQLRHRRSRGIRRDAMRGTFLGAALGTALLLPPIGSVAVFAALGLGLALPFVLIAFVPAASPGLPKPGPWMVWLQRILAIPMGLTALACLWLLWRLGDGNALQIGIAAGVALAFMLVGAGLMQRQGKQTGYVATLAALLVAAVAVPVMPERTAAAARLVPGAEAWSEERVDSELAAGHPVFVYFTADWCLTCKANEAAAIDRGEVRHAFKAGRSEGLRRRLDRRRSGDHALPRKPRASRRAALPVVRAGQDAEELPQILTPAMLTSRAQPRSASARCQTFLPATQVSSTCVRASACGSSLRRRGRR